MVKVLFFLRRYWKLITIASLLLGLAYSYYFLYRDNLKLESEKAIAEAGYEECQAISGNLADRLERLTKDLQELEKQRDILQAEVTESRITINRITSDRDRIILELGRDRNIPTDCEGKFNWLVEEFQRIEQSFYEEE